MRLVVLPQAFRTVVAPLGSLFIALTKNSSVAFLILAFPVEGPKPIELTGVASQLAFDLANPIPMYAGAAIGYLLLTLPAGFAFGWLERRVAIRR